MSLKLVRRPGSTFWHLAGTVRGVRLRESTRTGDKRLADQIRQKVERELWDRYIHGERATVRFWEAAESYLTTQQRAPSTCATVAKLLRHFGPETRLVDINQLAVDHAYTALLSPAAAGSTKLRVVLTPLKAIMEHAAVRGWCNRPAFETPKVAKGKTTFLRPAEARALLEAADEHIRPLLVFLLGTGCRMSEALDLKWDRVDLHGARAVVWQKQQNERHVDLPPVVVAALTALPNREGHVFRPPKRRGQLVANERWWDSGRAGGGQIKRRWSEACLKAGLPASGANGRPRAPPRSRASGCQRSRLTTSDTLTPPGITAYIETCSACVMKVGGPRSRWSSDTPI